MSVRTRPVRHVFAVLVCAAMLAACGAGDPDQAGSDRVTEEPLLPTIAVTTSLLGDVVTSITGDDATVEVVMAPGVDPHSFQPSAEQVQLLRGADLVVANGLGLEASLLDVLDAVRDDGHHVLEVAPQLDPVPFTAAADTAGDHEDDADHEDHEDDGDHEDHDGDGHDHGSLDPHVWFDPVRMAEGAGLIADAIGEVADPRLEVDWTRRGQDVAEEFLALDATVGDILAVVPDERRRLVTNHDSFGYLARAYDFEVVGSVVPGASTQADPSAEEFAHLAARLAALDVPAIFVEETASDRLATALAAEVGPDIAVVSLYSGALGGPGSGAQTYGDLVRTDASLIADALG